MGPKKHRKLPLKTQTILDEYHTTFAEYYFAEYL